MKTSALLSIASLAATILAAPAPAQSPNPSNTLKRACTVNIGYKSTWSEAPGSRWRYHIDWTGTAPENPTYDVLMGLGQVGCCASVDNPQAWAADGGVTFDFGEVVQPLGKTKAICQSTNVVQYVAKEWGCDVGASENAEIKCA